MSKIPSLSILIPTCNRNESLAKCLDNLIFDVIKESCEIIVSDDSKDQNAKNLILNDYNWVKWVMGPKKGPAANRNAASKHAKGSWLLFLDDDCLTDEKWLETIILNINESSNLIRAFEGSVHADRQYNSDLGYCPVNYSGGCFWSANIAIKTELFLKIGGFDENYPIAANEDQDIYLRLLNETSIPFLPKWIVYHPIIKRTFIEDLKRVSKVQASWTYHVSKHYPQNFRILQLLTHCYKSNLKELLKGIHNSNFSQISLNLYCILLGTFNYIKSYYKYSK